MNSRLETTDKRFLDRAQAFSADHTHLHGRITGNGADAHSMETCRLDLRHRVKPLFNFNFPELVVGLQTRTALGNEFEHPAPFLGAHRSVGPCLAHFLISLLFMKTTPHGQGDHVLGQNIQRPSQWLTRFDATLLHGLSGSGKLQNLHGMSWDTKNATGATGSMPTTPCALKQPRHAFGSANLDHLIDR